MAEGRWRRLDDLFARLVELDEMERQALLDREVGDDPELRQELEAMLASDARPADDVRQVVDRALLGEGADDTRSEGIPEGTLIGPWRIGALLGEGGMGSVYQAERADGIFEQEVALKVIKRGMDSNEILARFRSERQILARLEHPNIARLLDGGITDDGQPWFAMELVRGRRITDFARDEGLELDDRVALVAGVCDAVDYAHRNLVVHRDLKPSNVLVTEDGTPKLLDFGIAKLLTEEESHATTRAGARPLTPAYASPEQLGGRPVTTSTDTWALGVILYELVTEHRPWPRHATSDEVRDLIETTQPTLPSRVVTASPPDGTDPPHVSWGRRLRGDMDVICLKALRKEPERRYRAAAELAEDLRRFLERRPISARPDTLAYRAGRFVARNKTAVAMVATALAVLLGSSVFYTVTLQAERDRARIGEQKATAALTFLSDLFQASGPSAERSDTLPIGSFLDRGVAQIRADTTMQPEVSATLRRVLGNVVYRLGRVQQADSLVDEARSIRTRILTPDEAATDIELTDLDHLLGRIRHTRGDLESATELLETTAARQEATLGPQSEALGETLKDLAELMDKRSDPDSALALARRAVAIHEVNPGPQSAVYANTVGILARMLDLRGEFNEARPRYAAVRSALAASVGVTDPDYLDATFNLADMEMRAGNLEAAEPLFRDLIHTEIGIYGEEHTLVATDLNTLGTLLTIAGRYDEAERLVQRALDIRVKLLGPNHWSVATSHNALGNIADGRSDLDAAAREFRLAFEISRHDLGEDHRNRAMNLLNMAGVAGRRGQWTTALGYLRDADAMIGRIQTGETEDWGHVQFALAQLYEVMGRDADAMKVYERLLPYRRRTMEPQSDRLLRTIMGYGITLSDTGRQEEAIPLLEEAVAGFTDNPSTMHTRVLEAEADLALARARYAQAGGPALSRSEVPDLRRAVVTWADTAQARFGPNDTGTALVRARMAAFDSLVGGS